MLNPRDRALWTTPLLLVLAQLAFLALLAFARGGLTATFTPAWGYNVALYQQYSLRVLTGQLPYIDFQFEYPPLALIPMTIPHLFGIEEEYSPYELRYLLWGAVLSTAACVALLGILIGQGVSERVRVLVMYLVLLAPTALLALWRYDMFPAVLTLLAFGAVLRGHNLAGGAALGLAIGAKLYPVVLLPILGCYCILLGRHRAAVKFLGAAAVVALLPVLPLVPIDADAATYFIRYQADRPLEIGTVPAGFIRLMSVIGVIPRPERALTFGSENIDFPGAEIVLGLLPVLAVCLVAFVAICCVARFREEQATRGQISVVTVASFCVIALLALLVTAKVFSPQFVVWLLPFGALLPVRQGLLMTVAFALTFLVYPAMWTQFVAYEVVPVAALGARNVLLLALLVWLLHSVAPSAWQIRTIVSRTRPGRGQTGVSQLR